MIRVPGHPDFALMQGIRAIAGRGHRAPGLGRSRAVLGLVRLGFCAGDVEWSTFVQPIPRISGPMIQVLPRVKIVRLVRGPESVDLVQGPSALNALERVLAAVLEFDPAAAQQQVLHRR